MYKNKTLAIALAALFSTQLALADSEVSGKMVLEQGSLLDGGTLKNEMKVRLYADGDITDNMTYHAELQGSSDSDKVGGYSGEYTQNANLRELYVDMSGGDWEARLGKQQVVWGTADGMKLLDIINPTDYAEMAQDQMEDARIPVWALNLEAGSVQVVISEPKENVFAGLNRGTATGLRQNDFAGPDLTFDGTDTGNAFLMMGPDSITGQVDGMVNIVPDLGSIAAGFGGQFTNAGLAASRMTVSQFNGMTNAQLAGNQWPASATSINYGISVGADGSGIMDMFAGGYNTNLNNATSAGDWGVNKDSTFEYMGNTTFGTFDAFWNAGSEYVYNMPKSDDVDFAIKTSQTTKSGVNYSLNFSNSYDKNPIIDITWRGFDGGLLTQTSSFDHFDGQGASVPNQQDPNYAFSLETLALEDASGHAYGGQAVGGADGDASTPGDNEWQYAPTLQFEQSVVRTKNIGGSFDTSVEMAGLGPVVIRGEALYTMDAKQPVMNKARLSVGDMPGALTMQDADRFKFVLGADITVLTNMLISGQYITDRNLDFKDGAQADGEYTADYATMHLSNGFNKAIEDKQYYSLFFSKPFGESGQHRWNNITMMEEGVGENAYWNRLDVSYGLADDVEGTVEFNNYWGNANTQFGQLKEASNMQVGVKYSF